MGNVNGITFSFQTHYVNGVCFQITKMKYVMLVYFYLTFSTCGMKFVYTYFISVHSAPYGTSKIVCSFFCLVSNDEA